METLELLQEVIADYDGTVLIVSHDRDFLDRTVTAVLAFEGDGRIIAHAGGYSAYLERRRKQQPDQSSTKTATRKRSKTADKPAKKRSNRLTFKDKHALDTLPDEIDAITAEIATLEAQLADQALFASNPDKFTANAAHLAQLQSDKEAKELQWLEVAEKAEALDKD